MIADGPVHSAAAARLLDGRVAGSSAANDLVVQQAPPNNGKAAVRRTGEKRFGPLRAGAGKLTAHARWDDNVRCGVTEASSSVAEVSRITLSGGGNGSLVRVPEKISGLSTTGLLQRGGEMESVAASTITAGRISLVDGEVRIRVLRAPTLRVSMSAGGTGKVDYQPAVIEISGKNIPTKRLETVREHVDITVSDEVHEPESAPALIEPIGPLPLPPVEGLPSTGEPETAPAPTGTGGTKLRISLGDVRQAAKGRAVAARADTIKIALVREQRRAGDAHGSGDARLRDQRYGGDARGAGDARTKPGYGPSSVVADLGIGLLEGAAVAPQAGSGVSSGVSSGSAPGGSGAGAAAGGLPITGPRAVSMALGGVALLIGGIGVVLLTARKRRFDS
ncbi:hypothetical protein [Actinoplanes sp. GCM10030250]|uniref:hypothetical protein n=1 Tax=Actinoplanes sp. GCM10030250 TaxID=3273376 RepID=UPI00362398B7